MRQGLPLDETLDILINRYGDIWSLTPLRRGVIIRLREEQLKKLKEKERELRRLAMPVDEVVLTRRATATLKVFHRSIASYFEFLEPAELREIDKKVPRLREAEDLKERVALYLAQERSWRRAREIEALAPLAECLEGSAAILGELAVSRGIPYAFAGLVRSIKDYERLLTLHHASALAVLTIIGAREGRLAAGIVLSRAARERLEEALGVLEEFCLRAASDGRTRRQAWIIFGWMPTPDELRRIWSRVRELTKGPAPSQL